MEDCPGGFYAAGSEEAGVAEGGRDTAKVVPCPGSLFSEIVPPWASTIAFAIERPRPAPPVALVRDSSLR